MMRDCPDCSRETIGTAIQAARDARYGRAHSLWTIRPAPGGNTDALPGVVVCPRGHQYDMPARPAPGTVERARYNLEVAGLTPQF